MGQSYILKKKKDLKCKFNKVAYTLPADPTFDLSSTRTFYHTEMKTVYGLDF